MAEVQVSVDTEKNLTVFIFRGAISFNEVILLQQEFYANLPTPCVLVDFTEAFLTDVTTENLKKVLDVARSKADVRRGGKTAMVFSSDFSVFSFEVGRMYEIKGELSKLPFTIGSFKTKDEALKWLSLTE
jgi:hypothetical protein